MASAIAPAAPPQTSAPSTTPMDTRAQSVIIQIYARDVLALYNHELQRIMGALGISAEEMEKTRTDAVAIFMEKFGGIGVLIQAYEGR